MSRVVTYAMVAAVLIVAILLSLTLFATDIKNLYFGTIDKSACKASVAANSALCLKGITTEEIKCPAINLQIKDKNQEIVKEKLARSMFDCWDQFGRGEKEICGNEGIYCSICHYITFKNKDLKIQGLSDYLSKNYIPDGSMKYVDFLSGSKPISTKFQEQKEKANVNDLIDASVEDNYATVFVQIKDRDQLQNYLKKSEYAAPGVGIIALGFGVFKVGSAITGISWWTGGGLVAGITTQVAGGLIMLGGATYSFIASYFGGIPFEKISYVYFGPYDAESLRNLGCTNLPAQQS